MELSPFVTHNKFKRAEDYRNKACSIFQGDEPGTQEEAKQYLKEAQNDVVTGLLELFGVAYDSEWPLGRLLQLLQETDRDLPPIVAQSSEYQAIMADNPDYFDFGATSGDIKQLILYAAGGNGKFTAHIAHLLERFPDAEIKHALRCLSDNPHLAPLFGMTDEEKEWVKEILIKRKRTLLTYKEKRKELMLTYA